MKRLHDKRVAERKEKKASAAAALPSLPRPLSAHGGGGGGSLKSADGMILANTRGSCVSLAPSKEEIHKLFTRFDLNNDNTIDADELRAALTELGVSTTDVNRAEAVLRAYDTDNNKTLDEAEFGDLLGQLSSYLREADLRDIRRRKKHQMRRAAKAVEKQGRKITGSKSYP